MGSSFFDDLPHERGIYSREIRVYVQMIPVDSLKVFSFKKSETGEPHLVITLQM